jgi:CheY-like chemotaxis protein
MADERAPGILVVDTRPDLRALLQTILRHYGFDVWLAAGGDQAADLYAKHHRRIALTLLGSTGGQADVPRILKALQAVNPQVVCCVLSGTVPTDQEADLIAAGVVRVIRTPFDPAALAKQLWGLAGAGDRRSRPRYPRQATRVAVAAGLASEQVVESLVSDQSPEGLQLKASARLGEVGALLRIRPAEAKGDEPWVPVQVRYVREEGDKWALGCRYVHAEAVRE